MLRTSRQRPRIGLLISRLDRGFHRTAWLSVAETAQRHNADAICFDGGVLAPEDEWARKSNALYDLVSAQAMDGLLVWSSCLDWSVQPGMMQAFCDRFRPLPLVSIGRPLTGFPSVLVDNYQGMREAIHHLIEAHGYRRIAFLRGPIGNYEELLRYQAYVDELSEHGIPILPDLISVHTSWERSDGADMIRLLLDTRGLRPGRDFQALVSVGDDMACGAMEALIARGVRVPEDVAVVGFNDDQEGRAIVPSLTTVRQPVAQAGACATETLLALMRGEPAPEQIVLPLTTVIRQSCGCLSPTVLRAALQAPAEAPQRDIVDGHGFAGQIPTAIGENLDVAWVEKVSEALWRNLTADGCAETLRTGHGAFLMAFNEALRSTVAAGSEVLAWQEVFSALRRRLLQQVLPPERLRCASEFGKLYLRARIYLAIYLGVVVLAIATRSILPLLFIGLPNIYGAWLMLIYGLTQHAGLAENVLDHRLNTRTVYMNRINRYLYWNMGYHIEHHMFPMVPYYNLPKLHELVKADMPPAYNGLIAAYREIIPTLLRVARDPDYYLQRPLPPPLPQAATRQASQVVVSEAAPDAEGWVEACDLSLLLPGEVLRFEHGGHSYAVYRTQIGQLFASDGKCTHGNAQLADGFLQGTCIECPKHNGRFDVRTGAVLRSPPRVALKTYPAREKDGKVLLKVG